jgi:hypothetical protein
MRIKCCNCCNHIARPPPRAPRAFWRRRRKCKTSCLQDAEKRAHDAQNEERVSARILAHGDILRRSCNQEGRARTGKVASGAGGATRNQPRHGNAQASGDHGNIAYLLRTPAGMRDEPRQAVEERWIRLQQSRSAPQIRPRERGKIPRCRFVVLEFMGVNAETSEQKAQNKGHKHYGA